MRKRRLLVLVLGLAVFFAGAVAVWPQPERISRENLDRVTPGMTLAEVTAILGPPGNYRITTAVPDGYSEIFDQRGRYLGPDSGDFQLWWTDTADVTVYFDESGKTTRTLFVEEPPSNDSPFRKFCDWADRQWRRRFSE